MHSVTVFAPAKINLILSVSRLRDDGYHDINTIMQAVDLTDKLEFRESSKLELAIDPVGSVPLESNLITQAAFALKKIANPKQGASIKLYKNIPVSAGLGGGSSDAAAALIGLNLLWDSKLNIDELCAIGAKLGSDIPFFINSVTAVATKRGEELNALPSPHEKFALIIENPLPNIIAKTYKMYQLIRPDHYSLGHDHVEQMIRLISRKMPLSNCTYNVFDFVAPSLYGNYDEIKKTIKDTGIQNLTLAGSGPSFFSLYSNLGDGSSAQIGLTEVGIKSHLVALLDYNEGLNVSGNSRRIQII